MLTKSDLSSIQKIVKTEIKSELGSVKSDVSSLKSDVSSLKSDVSTIKSDIQLLKSGQRKTNRELSGWTKFFDKDYLKVKKDVREIQSHLNLPLSEF